MIDISILIPTRDRASYLLQTLEALRRVEVPPGLRIELVVVDNAPSNDETREVVLQWSDPRMEVRYVREPLPGVARARNVAIQAARGKVTLWTDDDCRPPPDWITGMALPVLEGKGQIFQGGVRLASHLLRPWMDHEQRALYASTEVFDTPAYGVETPEGRRLRYLFTCSMAVAREAFERLPPFDDNLGAGALGYSEDSLMAHHMYSAGFAIHDARHVVSEHHFDPDRLTYKACASMWEKLGRSQAYVDYHWKHHTHAWAPWLAPIAPLLLSGYRALFRPATRRAEGISGTEVTLAYITAYTQQLTVERKRARLYEQYGLRRAG